MRTLTTAPYVPANTGTPKIGQNGAFPRGYLFDPKTVKKQPFWGV